MQSVIWPLRQLQEACTAPGHLSQLLRDAAAGISSREAGTTSGGQGAGGQAAPQKAKQAASHKHKKKGKKGRR